MSDPSRIPWSYLNIPNGDYVVTIIGPAIDPIIHPIDPAVTERITIAKLVGFFRAWLAMLREGAVPQQVAEGRARHCLTVCGKINVAAAPGSPDPGSGGKAYCGNCGCGQREFAAM